MASANGSSAARSDPIYLGWQHAVVVPDPGPPPKRPTPSEMTRLSEEWLEEQKQDEAVTNRPLRVAAIALAVLILLWPLLAQLRILPGLFATVLVAVSLLLAVPVGIALWQGHAVTRARLTAEERRLAEQRSSTEHELHERQREHAERYTAWQQRKRAFEAQPRWYTVAVPREASRVDIIGGTDAGWAAVLTTIAGARLRAGDDVTIVDLSGRAVASDVVALSRNCGVSTRVWVLPADVPQLSLGTNLGSGAFADILAAVVASLGRGHGKDGDDNTDRDTAADVRLLEGLLEVLGSTSSVSRIIAGLRVLTADVPDGAEAAEGATALTPKQCAELRRRFGGNPETRERAWSAEQRLIALEGLGSRLEDEGYAQVKVIATDRTSGEITGGIFGSYTVVALRHLLHQLGRRRSARRWRHTVVVCGADMVGTAEREALAAAAQRAQVRLVYTYRRLSDIDAENLRTGSSLVAAMRTDDRNLARVSAECLRGTADGPPVLSPHPLTEVIGEALSDAIPDTYRAESYATADTEPLPRSPTRKSKAVAPLDYVRHLRSATAWGRTTHQAEQIDAADPLGTGSVREITLDETGLAALPPTALIMPGSSGPVLVDANPGIMGLPTATLAAVEDAPLTSPETVDAEADGEVPPNLGPPPERLDWRSRPARGRSDTPERGTPRHSAT